MFQGSRSIISSRKHVFPMMNDSNYARAVKYVSRCKCDETVTFFLIFFSFFSRRPFLYFFSRLSSQRFLASLMFFLCKTTLQSRGVVNLLWINRVSISLCSLSTQPTNQQPLTHKKDLAKISFLFSKFANFAERIFINEAKLKVS